METKFVGLAIITGALVVFGGCSGPVASQEAVNVNNSPANAAANVKVDAQALNWDDDPAIDGLRVWVELQNTSHSPVKYTNTDMPVRIIVRPSPTETLCEADVVLYSDTATLKDWTEDSFRDGATGIKDIPWGLLDQSLLAQLQKYGLIEVSVTLPNGTQIVGSLNEVLLKP